MQKNSQRIKRIIVSCDKLTASLAHCNICPRKCGINRLKGEVGYCNAPLKSIVYTAFKHPGEEPGISNKDGSGTIFFSGCNLQCVYCQNHKFSHSLSGTIITNEELAQLMLKLQQNCADNINLVTPTHFLPQIAAAILIALKNGLTIPIVYNTSGFETIETIEIIEPFVDIYLTDIKYIDKVTAQRYSNAYEYPKYSLNAAAAMYKQRPQITMKHNKITQGLIIRHLVLPGQTLSSKKILRWIKNNVPGAKASIMFQYQPYCDAKKFSEINRRINSTEYQQICQFAKEIEINGWIQDFNPEESLAGTHLKPGFDNIH